eukprot:9023435-Heterocapsa_arctica.AAC.1
MVLSFGGGGLGSSSNCEARQLGGPGLGAPQPQIHRGFSTVLRLFRLAPGRDWLHRGPARHAIRGWPA